METFGEAVRRLRGPMSLRELARRAFVDPGHLSRIEAGLRSPTAHLASALDTTLDADGTLMALATVHQQVTSRRAQLGDRGLQPGPSLKPSDRAQPNDLAAMMSLRAADSRVGGGYLYASVTVYLRDTVAPRLFDVDDFTDQYSIFAAAAALTEMAGWMAHDAGRDQVAGQHFHRALGLARGSQDHELSAHVLGSLSHLAHHRGQPEQGLLYARQGQDVAGPFCHPSVAARLFALQARGSAALGQEDDSIDHLTKAEKALANEPVAAVSPWVSQFDHASLAAEAARSFGQLGQFGAARRQAERIAALRPAERARSRAFAAIMIASTLVAQGKPDEACFAASGVIESTRNLGSYLVVKQLERLDQKLAPHQADPVVASFREQLRDELHERTWLSGWLPSGDVPPGRTVPT